MAKREYLYFNQIDGNVIKATKSQAKRLPDDYKQLEFLKNEKGEPVMRFKFNGATVDVLENNDQEVQSDGNRDTE